MEIRQGWRRALGGGAIGLLVATVMLSPGLARADTNTATLSVSATVVGSCSIAAGPLTFGNYDPTGVQSATPLDGTASITVQCLNSLSADVTLGQGANADAGSTDASPLRRLSNGSGDYLSYDLYSDSSRTVAWGNTVGSAVGHVGTGLPVIITVYGRLQAGQTGPTGVYTDTVVATITF